MEGVTSRGGCRVVPGRGPAPCEVTNFIRKARVPIVTFEARRHGDLSSEGQGSAKLREPSKAEGNEAPVSMCEMGGFA